MAGYEEDEKGQCQVRDPCARLDACGCLPSSDPHAPCLARGACSLNASAPLRYSCSCATHFSGSTCERCASGWQGAGCDEAVGGPPPPPAGGVSPLVLGLVLGAVFLLLLIVAAVFWWRRRQAAVPEAEALGVMLAERGESAHVTLDSDSEEGGRPTSPVEDKLSIGLDEDDEDEKLVGLNPAPSSSLL